MNIRNAFKIKIAHFLSSRDNCKIAAPPPTLPPVFVFKFVKMSDSVLYPKIPQTREYEDIFHLFFFNKIAHFRENEDNCDFAASPTLSRRDKI